MDIAVVGATGTLGRPLVAELEARGHRVRALSRRSPDHPADVVTGAGLRKALAGAQVVVNASNAAKQAATTLVDGTRHLLDAAPDAHHVCVSIVGIEDVPLGYYRTKVAQEAVVREAAAPWTIVRVTQFHELLAGLVDGAGRRHVRLRSAARFQPIDPRDAARAVADAAEAPPRRGVVEVAGPEVLTLSDLGTAGIPLPLPLPPRLGRALRAGALTAAAPDVRGTTTWASWRATS